MALKSLQKSKFCPFPFLEREEKEHVLLQRLNIELIRVNWLLNRFTA
jgi:hypothetical protein